MCLSQIRRHLLIASVFGLAHALALVRDMSVARSSSLSYPDSSLQSDATCSHTSPPLSSCAAVASSSDVMSLSRALLFKHGLSSSGLRAAVADFHQLYTGSSRCSDESIKSTMRALAAAGDMCWTESTAWSAACPSEPSFVDLTSEEDNDDDNEEQKTFGRSGHPTHHRDDDKAWQSERQLDSTDEVQRSYESNATSPPARHKHARVHGGGFTPGWQEQLADLAACLALQKHEAALLHERRARQQRWKARGLYWWSLCRRAAVLLCWSLLPALLSVLVLALACGLAPWMMEVRKQLLQLDWLRQRWSYCVASADAANAALGRTWATLSSAVHYRSAYQLK